MIDLTKFNEIFGKNVTKDEIKSIKKKAKLNTLETVIF